MVMGSTKPPSDEAKIAAEQLWRATPKAERSVRHITKKLNEAGHAVSKSVVGKWSKHWTDSLVDETAQRLLTGPVASPPPELLEGISQELRDALTPRLLALSPGKGLDRAENAVIMLVDAIALKAPEIAAQLLDAESETVETTGKEGAVSSTTTQKAQVARSAVTAVATLAQAMQVIMASRQMLSVSHRNFAEGDMLTAQAEVKRAEARRINAESDAIAKQIRDGSDANVIDGDFTHVNGSQSSQSAQNEREAREELAAMADEE